MFMSYKQIETVVSCGLCKNTLSDPRLVPCGRTFCNNCIAPASFNNDFECLCEKEIHEIPSEGFPKNLLCVSLLNQKPCQVSRGEKAEKLRQKLKKISSDIDDIDKNLKYSENKIREHCYAVRNEIDISAETYIQEIQIQRDKLLKMVNDYENDCLASLNKEWHIQIELQKSLKEIKDFCTKWQNSLNHYEIDEIEVTKALDSCETYIVMLGNHRLVSDRHIFNDKIVQFIPNDRNNEQFGTIKFKNLKSFIDFSSMSKINLKKDGIHTSFILNGFIDMDFLSEDKILICVIDSLQYFKFIVYDLVKRVNTVSRRIPYDVPNLKSIKCHISQKNIILISIIFGNECSSLSFVMNANNFEINKEKIINDSIIDFQASSEFIYYLAKSSKFPSNACVYEILTFDHSLTNIRDTNTRNFRITSEILNMKINKEYIFLFDESSKVTLINIKDYSYVRSFIINGTMFSLYNEFYLISYNIISKIIWYHDITDATIKHTENLDNKIKQIILIKGEQEKILFYDYSTNDIYYRTNQ